LKLSQQINALKSSWTINCVCVESKTIILKHLLCLHHQSQREERPFVAVFISLSLCCLFPGAQSIWKAKSSFEWSSFLILYCVTRRLMIWFHILLGLKPPSLFLLGGCSHISTLMMETQLVFNMGVVLWYP
jgi:hypothetical protein